MRGDKKLKIKRLNKVSAVLCLILFFILTPGCSNQETESGLNFRGIWNREKHQENDGQINKVLIMDAEVVLVGMDSFGDELKLSELWLCKYDEDTDKVFKQVRDPDNIQNTNGDSLSLGKVYIFEIYFKGGAFRRYPSIYDGEVFNIMVPSFHWDANNQAITQSKWDAYYDVDMEVLTIKGFDYEGESDVWFKDTFIKEE
jgi:hypothetical protein